jgi:2-haloacid dehalogenase
MIEAIVFDAYGTLFDVYSVGALAEQLFPGHGKSLSKLWRDKQIEYTRLRTMSHMYKPFCELTEDALVFSCKELGLNYTTNDKDALMNQYSRLPAFKENVFVLQALKLMGIKLAILRFVVCVS